MIRYGVPEAPRSDFRAKSVLSAQQLSGWLYADAGMERQEFERLSVLAGARPDLAPLIEILVESYHRRSATSYAMSAFLHSSAPAAPSAPPGWWGRLKAAWKVLFPGR